MHQGGALHPVVAAQGQICCLGLQKLNAWLTRTLDWDLPQGWRWPRACRGDVLPAKPLQVKTPKMQLSDTLARPREERRLAALSLCCMPLASLLERRYHMPPTPPTMTASAHARTDKHPAPVYARAGSATPAASAASVARPLRRVAPCLGLCLI